MWQQHRPDSSRTAQFVLCACVMSIWDGQANLPRSRTTPRGLNDHPAANVGQYHNQALVQSQGRHELIWNQSWKMTFPCGYASTWQEICGCQRPDVNKTVCSVGTAGACSAFCSVTVSLSDFHPHMYNRNLHPARPLQIPSLVHIEDRHGKNQDVCRWWDKSLSHQLNHVRGHW